MNRDFCCISFGVVRFHWFIFWFIDILSKKTLWDSICLCPAVRQLAWLEETVICISNRIADSWNVFDLIQKKKMGPREILKFFWNFNFSLEKLPRVFPVDLSSRCDFIYKKRFNQKTLFFFVLAQQLEWKKKRTFQHWPFIGQHDPGGGLVYFIVRLYRNDWI